MGNVLVENGQVVSTTASSQSLSSSKTASKSSLGKEDFMTLLVAQMKYQDPMQPASNTEYVSQLATFSELEEMQNLNSTMDASHASSLVGKNVMVKVTSDITGETYYETGKVDSITVENGKVYLSIKDAMYSIDDLDMVIDDQYLDAITVTEAFTGIVKAMPSENKLTLADQSKVELVRKAYDEMTDYQKQFIPPETLELFTKLEDRMNSLVASDKSRKFDNAVNELPELEELTAADAEKVSELRKTYDELSDFQKNFINEDTLKKLEAAEEKMKELVGEPEPEEEAEN